jgi:hypothetical protein
LDDPLWKQLEEFTREEVGGCPLFGKEPAITPATDIFKDLRVDGDDAIEFLEKWFDKFNVAGVESFPVNRYFHGEGHGFSGGFSQMISAWISHFRTGRPIQIHDGKKPLTLGMLLEAMQAGRWDTEAIEANQQPQP